MTKGDDQNLRERLKIESPTLEEVNRFLLDPDNPAINAVLRIVAEKGKKGTGYFSISPSNLS